MIKTKRDPQRGSTVASGAHQSPVLARETLPALTPDLGRRNFLKTLAVAGLALTVPFPWRDAAAVAAAPEPGLVIRFVAFADRVSVWPGAKTRVLRYGAQVLKGRANALRPGPAYLGPALELRTGERVRFYFENRLPGQVSIMNWHGLIVPARDDGYPGDAVGPGKTYTYDFTVRNRAGTYVYHPDPERITGEQVYGGMAGLLIVHDAAEAASGLPGGAQELHLVIQDRRRGDNNQLVFERSMMDQMTGVLGKTVLVNGQPDKVFQVARRPYRLRIANLSNARIYKLAWSDNRPMQAVGTGGGLLPASVGPQVLPYVVLAPFERIELLEDFGTRQGNTEITLLSRAFSGWAMHGMMDGVMGNAMGGMMGQRMGGSRMGMMSAGTRQGEELAIAHFKVAAGPRIHVDKIRLPDVAISSGQAASEVHTQLAFRMMHGLLNGRSFQMNVVAGDEHVALGKPVLWAFANDGAGMAMPHPMHIHSAQFQIVARSGMHAPDLRDGMVDVGFKDTVLVLPGERVQVRFTPQFPGMFTYHCHNLEHMDNGMMRNYVVS